MNTKPSVRWLVTVALLLCSSLALAQAGARDSQRFEAYKADAHEDLVTAQEQLVATVALYNSLVNQEASDPQKAYKDLAKAAEKCDDRWSDYGKKVAKMRKQADKMFSAWNKEVSSFENEQMKELGMQRAATAQAAYDYMIEHMDAADAAYDPFAQLLAEQATFMSRDLSPESMEILKPMAEQLNGMAKELYAGFDAILAGPPPAEEVAAIEPVADEALDEPASLEEVVEQGETEPN